MIINGFWQDSNLREEFLHHITTINKKVLCAQIHIKDTMRTFNLPVDHTPEEYEWFLASLERYQTELGYEFDGRIWYGGWSWSEWYTDEEEGYSHWWYHVVPPIPPELGKSKGGY
jgi:hypothetical protein